MDLAQDETLQTGLLRIRQRFVLRLDAHADEIFCLLELLGNPATDHTTCTAIHAIAHKFHGTAKTVGFTQIGTKSAALERCITQAMATAAPLDVEPIRDLLEDLLDEIETTLHEAPQQGQDLTVHPDK